ncbi:MAG: hypothetical protein JXA96_06010 [Sedimentisphaerales bacterium]|nr:hypothetical protein [Sedimentisphaerales bacterium]
MLKSKKYKMFRNQNKITFPKRSGGTIVNILVVGIIIFLIGAGIMSLMKQTGETVEEYGEGMINTTNKASGIVCTSNMNQIFQILQMYSISEGELPASYEALVNEVGTSGVFHCSESDSPNYSYIPGQTLSSPPDNILLYESVPVHNGMCNVLRVSGKVEMLTPEELQAAIQQTESHL